MNVESPFTIQHCAGTAASAPAAAFATSLRPSGATGRARLREQNSPPEPIHSMVTPGAAKGSQGLK